MTKFQFIPGPNHVSVDEIEPTAGQKAVASAPVEGVSLVFGAPSTGKTAAIRFAYRNLIETGLAHEQIQVFSATRLAANVLRDQLALDQQGATTGPLAKTLTSFAFSILAEHSREAGKPRPELISGSEQDFIFSELISLEIEAIEAGQSLWPESFTKQILSLNGFRVELRDLITSCLEHAISPEQLIELAKKHARPDWTAASSVLCEYLLRLGDDGDVTRFDASSLLVAATEVLVNGGSARLVEGLRIILVDDAQELTPASQSLLMALAAKGCGLCLIGDPDASTLGFRAANPLIMSNLANEIAASRKSNVNRVVLDALEPKDEEIAVAMQRSVALIEPALAGTQRKALSSTTKSKEGTGLLAKTFTQPHDEMAWIARQIKQFHLDREIAYSEIAVVARSADQLYRIERALAAQSLPVHIFGAQSAFAKEFASSALLHLVDSLFKSSSFDIETATELLTSPFCGLDQLALRRLRRSLRRQELESGGHSTSDELLCQLFAAPGSAATIATSEGRKVSKFLKWYFEARDMAGNPESSIEDLLWKAWSESKLEEAWKITAEGEGEVAQQANRNLDVIVALFASANRFAERNPGADPMIFIRQQLLLQLPEDTLANTNLDLSRVTLHTPSSLISKRYRVVIIPGLIEGVWPNLRPRSSLLGARLLDALASGIDAADTGKSELPNELRMFYKALGAATETVILTATYGEDTQVSQFFSIATREIPAPTNHIEEPLNLRSLAGSLRRTLAKTTDDAVSKDASFGLARLAEAGVAGAHPSSWYGLKPISTSEPLIDLAAGEEVVIRPSQLEAFLTCPLHWFLANHGANESNFSANLGTLVHQALEVGVEPDEEVLWGLVESKWHTLQFESEWQDRAGRRRGRALVASMVDYLKEFERAGGEVVGREVNFDFQIGQAIVRGQIDRIESLGEDVTIVDLKTGKKQFTTEEAQNHVQLGLYQLAFAEGALSHLEDMPENATLAGAKLLLVTPEKAVTRAQSSIESDKDLNAKIRDAIAKATTGMSMSDQIFVAELDNHCQNDQQYGTCQIHVTKAVSYVG